MTFGHLYSKICSLATGLPWPKAPNWIKWNKVKSNDVKKFSTKDKMDKNSTASIIDVILKIHHWLKYSNKTFLNRCADLMLTISLGNAFQSLTVLHLTQTSSVVTYYLCLWIQPSLLALYG